MKAFLKSRLNGFGILGVVLILWLWSASVRNESVVALLAPRTYSVGHNDSLIFFGRWQSDDPFRGPWRWHVTLNGSSASSGPLFPWFRSYRNQGLFVSAIGIPYWSVLLAWILTWGGLSLCLRRLRRFEQPA